MATPSTSKLCVRRERVIELLLKLIALPSVNPSGYPATPDQLGEHRMVKFILDFLRPFGFEVQTEKVAEGRENVYCLFPGREQGNLTGIDIHTDTVNTNPVAANAFIGELRDGKVFGRGSVDNKAFIAIVLALAEALHESGERPLAPLLAMLVVDEERFGAGSRAAAKWVESKYGKLGWLIVAEPTENVPGCGHNGVLRVEFSFKGQTAHASTPHEGHDANLAAVMGVVALKNWAESNRRNWTGSRSAPTIVFSEIHGGDGPNVVSGSSTLTVDMRITEAVRSEEMLSLMRTVCGTAAMHFDSAVTVDSKILSQSDASFQDDCDLHRTLSRLTGKSPIVLPFGTDWARLRNSAKETVVFGPGSIRQAHTVDEWILESEIETTTDLFTQLVMNHRCN